MKRFTMKLLAIILIFIPIRICSMEKLQVITEPYQPSFSAKHPRLFTSGVAALAGMASFGIASYFKDKVNPLYVGAAGALAGGIYGLTRKCTLIDTLLMDPLKALNHCEKVNHSLGAAISEHKSEVENMDPSGIQFFDPYIRTSEKRNPLFLLGECDASHCLATRSNNPWVRDFFEHKVIEALKNKLTDSRPIQYVSFACGGMFQDAVILSKFLAQHPTARLEVHLIDIQQGPYEGYLSATGIDGKRLVNFDHPFSVDELDAMISQELKDKNITEEVIKKEWGSKKKMRKATFESCYLDANRIRQMGTFLSKTFPKAHLDWHVHQTAESYLKYIEANNIDYADVAVVADITDDISRLHKAAHHYMHLCRVINEKKDAANIWLHHDFIEGKITINTIHNEAVDDSQMIEFELDNDHAATVYLQEIIIGQSRS